MFINNTQYVLCPGDITSKNDGQIHYINSRTLARLYKIREEDCVPREEYFSNKGKYKHAIELHPRYDGDYTLPTRK